MTKEQGIAKATEQIKKALANTNKGTSIPEHNKEMVTDMLLDALSHLQKYGTTGNKFIDMDNGIVKSININY